VTDSKGDFNTGYEVIEEGLEFEELGVGTGPYGEDVIQKT